MLPSLFKFSYYTRKHDKEMILSFIPQSSEQLASLGPLGFECISRADACHHNSPC